MVLSRVPRRRKAVTKKINEMKTLKTAHKTEITSVINPTNYRIHLNKCIRKKTNKTTHHNVFISTIIVDEYTLDVS